MMKMDTAETISNARTQKESSQRNRRSSYHNFPQNWQISAERFTNRSSVTHKAASQSELLKNSGLTELPVIMMLMQVTANAGQQIGTLIDLASDTNYITHKAAERLGLSSEEINLVVHGVGGMTMKVNTKRCLLKIRVKTLD